MVDNVVEIIMKKMSGEKKDSGHCTKYCHIFFTASIFTFFLVCNFYFFNHMKNNNDLLDQRVKHLENDAVFVKEIATNITQLLSDMTNDVGGSNKSVSGRLNNEGRKRIKRDNDEKPIDNHKKTDEKSIEQTLHSLRREMFSLNDRYGGENVGIPKGGPPGPPGSPGKSGSPGPPGINGINGYHGERGAKGPIGPPGSLGPEGPLGKDGIPGINGIPGIPGYAGRKGEKGNPGRDGRTGNEGISGQTGRDGPPGRPGRTGQKGEVGDCTCADVKSKMPNLTERRIERPVTDLVYTIWGSSTCPSANDILFSGEVAVGKFDHSDGIGSSNPICFPLTNRPRRRAKRDVIFEERITTRSPEMPKRSTKKNMEDNTYFNKTFTNYTNGTSSPNRSTTTTPLTNSTSSANVYPFIPKYAKLTGTRKYVPCASCHVKRKSVKMMIPSRIHCPPSWTIEYQGYLMNYHHNSKESEVLCVYDQALGVSPSSDEGIRHIISSYMTHLRIDCHSFPCPPFHEELLKCVVCSK